MDIYFKEEYARIYELNGDGKVEKFNYESEEGRVEYLFLKKLTKAGTGKYYDITTPYGYGGPIFFPKNPNKLSKLVAGFRNEFEGYCRKNKIISEFIRFHPLFENYRYMDNHLEVICLQNTICMNLNSEEQILSEMSSQARNKLRKAIKSNVTVKREISENNIKNFMNIYYETMNKNNALSYYYFDEIYFKNLYKLGKKRVELFNAYHNNDLIATTFILKGEDVIHYHLSANTKKGYQLAANNLLLFEVAKWGVKNGYKAFHLGGGYGKVCGENIDPLYKFKSSFNKNGILEFHIGKKIHNHKIFNYLVKVHREKTLEENNENCEFFPPYRAGNINK